jgi:hypothetical protein
MGGLARRQPSQPPRGHKAIMNKTTHKNYSIERRIHTRRKDFHQKHFFFLAAIANPQKTNAQNKN